MNIATKTQSEWIINLCCLKNSFFSGCAGLIAATISTPADVVKTRIMNNPKVYRGSLDCFMCAVCIIMIQLIIILSPRLTFFSA